MATTTFTAAPSASNGSLMYAWAHPVSAFMATAGWTQNGDTGQIVWPVSIVNLVSVVANGATAIFTYTLLQGAALRIGGSIITKGCTTSALNTTSTITALGAGTFTVSTGTTVTETETVNVAFGSVSPQVSITNAIGNGSSNTYTYSLLDGPNPIAGQSIVITGCTTSGFNTTLTIASVNTGAGTFITTTGISHASEVETGAGLVTATPAVVSTGSSGALTLPPAINNTLFEVWKMGDGNGFPLFLKIFYGGNPNAAADAGLQVLICAGTDGAGNPTGAQTSTITAFKENAASASTFNCYLSGSSNRISIGMFTNCTVAGVGGCLINVERSHDSSGVDTTTYATLAVIGTGASGALVVNQQSITATAVTVVELKIPTVITTSTGTGSFGSSTLIAPAFPVVGAIGNPMVGLLIGKLIDWTDTTQFSFTIYNTARNYIVFNTAATTWVAAGALVHDTTATCCPIMRYE